jgi:acyl carrier protein
MTMAIGSRHETILPVIDQVAAASPGNVAVRGPDGTLTYGTLRVRAERLARRLGQVDRDALPIPVETAGDDPGGRCPETVVETATASILAELLGIDEIGIDQNFFLLGGHSMLGAQVIVRLEDLFGVELTLRRLFDHPTVAEIATEVERLMAIDQADVAAHGC